MPQGFDQDYRPANPFANVQTPWLDDAAAPHNPFPEWKPNARGDAKALLPYVDDDIGEEKSNPVAQGLTVADAGHLAADAVIEGETSAHSWAEMTAKMGHHAAETLAGEGTTAETALAGATAVLAPVAVGGGIFEMLEGYDMVKGGQKLEGTYKMTEGGLGAASGGFGIAGLAGSGTAATAAPLFASGAVGLKTGRYGDNQVKQRGWIKDTDGSSLSASEWAGHNGRHVDDYLTEHGHPHLGTAAGVATTVASIAPAAGIAVGGAVAGGVDALEDAGSWLGTKAAHTGRAHHYENYKGIDMTKREAKELADYDDAQQEASNRATWNTLQRIWAEDDK